MDAWLYIVLLGLVLVVYAKLVPKKESGTKQAQTSVIKEIEDTMEQFSAELEEENRQLLGLVAEMKKEHDVHAAKLQGRIEALEQQNRAVTEQLGQLVRAEQSRKEASGQAEGLLARSQSIAAASVRTEAPVAHEPMPAAEVVAPPEKEPEKASSNIRDRYAAVFQLYDQGKSTEYIAKKLEMNKGEVMLIIQLAKQEDQARV